MDCVHNPGQLLEGYIASDYHSREFFEGICVIHFNMGNDGSGMSPNVYCGNPKAFFEFFSYFNCLYDTNSAHK